MTRMKIYRVGGCVRDKLLGRPAHDEDFVVTGVTEQEFLAAFPNARKVGASFPVFLVDGKEYALARKERKVSSGHKGFICDFGPEVTIEEDLLRRDLTINAIAEDAETGEIVAVPGALEDLRKGILRHVSDAFREDPLRVFRVARFLAQLPDFTVASETEELCRDMVPSLKELPGERVFWEMKKALLAPAPHRFFKFLVNIGTDWVVELIALKDVPAGRVKHLASETALEHSFEVLKRCAAMTKNPLTRLCALLHDLGKAHTDPSRWPAHHDHDKLGVKPAKDFCRRLRLPYAWTCAVVSAVENHMKWHRLLVMRAGKAVMLVEKTLAKFPPGPKEFLRIMLADDMTMHSACRILKKIHRARRVKLPRQHWNKGRKSREILLNFQAQAWKRGG